MAYTYTPRAEPPKLGPGVHLVTVKDAFETTSRKGNPMIELHLTITGFEVKPIKAYMVLSETSAWKTRQMRMALGFADPIDEETVIDADEMIGRHAQVRMERPDGSKYLEIEEWLPRPQMAVATAIPARRQVAAENDDEIPF